MRSLFVVIFTILILEIVGLFLLNNNYYWDFRYLYYSNNAVRDIGQGIWTYKPNREIRFVATYELPRGKRWVEYDCRFQTNDLGLIDTGSGSQEVDIVVLGDSFTEGHGGCPWLDSRYLSKITPGLNIVNAGLQNNGIQAFERLLKFIESERTVKNVVVIAISNDFKRLVPSQSLWRNQNCVKGIECSLTDDYWHFIPIDTTEESLLKDTKRRSKGRHGDSSYYKEALEFYSFTYSVFRKIVMMVERDEKGDFQSFERSKEVFDLNMAALLRIKSRYPEMKFILVPQRDEVGFPPALNKDTKYIQSLLSDSGISFERCELSMSDYMYIDGHPNRKGYGKLRGCFEKVVLSEYQGK